MADLAALAARVNALPPPDRLRLAAELLEACRPVEANALVQKMADELGALVRLGPRVPCPKNSSPVCLDWTACAAAGKCVRG